MRCQATVILNMSSPLLVGSEIELTGNFPIGTRNAVALIVDVCEEERTTPFVGLEHLNGCGHTWAR